MSTSLRRLASIILVSVSCCGVSVTSHAQETTGSERPDSSASSSASDPVDTSAPGPSEDTLQTSIKGPTKPVTAQTFASQAAIISKAEIELGQLAVRNGKDPSVKQYGQRMVKDHTAADSQLKPIAAKENLTLPPDLDAEHRAIRQKLSSLQGEDFDVAYRAEMAKGHDRAVALFESAAQTTT